MILGYYGHHIDQQEALAAVPKGSDKGPLLTDLAHFAQKVGLKVDCLAYNLYLTAPEDAALSMGDLVRTLQIERRVIKDDSYLRMIDSILGCIGAGANYLIARPSTQTITSYLERGIPLILSVSHAAWYNTQGDPYEAHAVVLSGIEGDNIHFIDPGYSPQPRLAVEDLRFLDPGQAREGSVSLDDLRFAMLSRKTTDAAAYLLAVKPGEPTLVTAPHAGAR